MTEIDYAARAAKGAELLDEVRPGWEDRVNPDSLNMYNTSWCVLGQLEGDYDFAVHTLLKLSYQASWVHGFHIPLSEVPPSPPGGATTESMTEVYRPLTEAWRALIAERRA